MEKMGKELGNAILKSAKEIVDTDEDGDFDVADVVKIGEDLQNGKWPIYWIKIKVFLGNVLVSFIVSLGLASFWDGEEILSALANESYLEMGVALKGLAISAIIFTYKQTVQAKDKTVNELEKQLSAKEKVINSLKESAKIFYNKMEHVVVKLGNVISMHEFTIHGLKQSIKTKDDVFRELWDEYQDDKQLIEILQKEHPLPRIDKN